MIRGYKELGTFRAFGRLFCRISNFAYKLDKKYDDGLYNYGDIRASCCGTYENSIKNKCNCGYILYVILF